jgi:hypothetical protein
MTRETVPRPTPARAATSSRVGRLPLRPRAPWTTIPCLPSDTARTACGLESNSVDPYPGVLRPSAGTGTGLRSLSKKC